MKALKCLEILIDNYAAYTSDENLLGNDKGFEQTEFDDYFKLVENKWKKIVIGDLGCSPDEYMESVPFPESEEEIFEIVKRAASTIAVDTPSFLIEYLKKSEFAESVVRHMLKNDIFETDYYAMAEDDKDEMLKFDVYGQAAVIASGFKNLIPDLIDTYRRSHEENERLHDNISWSLSVLEAYKEVVAYINSEEKIAYKHITLLDLLLNADPSDEIYYCLKNSFKRADNDDTKSVIAFIFSEYGDSRIVPVLRRFAKQLQEKINNNEEEDAYNFHITCRVIDELGGFTEDLQNN